MMLNAVLLCLGCADPQQPQLRRLPVPEPLAVVGVSDGCARFDVTFAPGFYPIVDSLYNTAGCATNQLKIVLDAAASYDPPTNTLRLPFVLVNTGTVPVIPAVRVRYDADSVMAVTGAPPGWTNNILGYLPDSSGSAGRIAFWRYDTYLAASGQTQVLMPGGRSQRRWLELRGTSWVTRTRIRLATTGDQSAVPAVAPDTVPRALVNSLPVLDIGGGARIKAQLIWVQFFAGTSQSARQSAIASAGGTVVGGRGGIAGDGWYLVRISSANTLSALVAQLSPLRSNPNVMLATEYVVSIPNDYSWAKPNDGGNWEQKDWRTDPTTAEGANAARERIRAPMAWGCATGDTLTRVSIVDGGFYGVSDLVPNIAGAIFEPTPYRQHGTRVASIVAARGNNTFGIAGVMWRAALNLRAFRADTGIPPTLTTDAWNVSLQRHLEAAGLGGNSIIIIVNNRQYGGLSPDTVGNITNKEELYWRDAALRNAITNLRSRTPSIRPLFVVSAGNEGIDARYAGYVAAKFTYPEQVLVVGGLANKIDVPNQSISMYNDSMPTNRGPAIDIYAPGENVGQLDPGGVVTRVNGTSYATHWSRELPDS